MTSVRAGDVLDFSLDPAEVKLSGPDRRALEFWPMALSLAGRG
jgi:hypothetical protein